MRFIYVYFLLKEISLFRSSEADCSYQNVTKSVDNCPILPGDIYIGGLVNIHRVSKVTDDSLTEGPIQEECSNPFDHGMFTSLSIIYAIEEINAGKFLDLTNVTLGYMLTDGCRSRSVALRGAADISSGACGIEEAPVAVIADTFSASIGPVANYFQLTNTPVIAVWATSVEFTDKNLYPTFFRTVPNDDNQAEALVHIVKSFGWTWVGALATDENYGRLGIEHFKEVAKLYGICISFEMYLPTVIDSKGINDTVDLLMTHSDVKVIITFINSGYEVAKIFEECDRRKINTRVWIGTDVWIISRIFASNKYYKVIDAAIGTSIEEVRNDDFWNYFLSRTPNNTNLDSWFNKFWEKTFSCNLFENGPDKNKSSINQECWSHSLNEKADEFKTYIDFTTYNAVYAIAYAIYNIINCTDGLLKDGLCPDVNDIQPWQLMQYLRNVEFQDHIKNRQFMFDENYEVPARYTVYWWKRTTKNTVNIQIVGEYDSSATSGDYLQINESAILWDSGRSEKVPKSFCSQPCQPGTRKRLNNDKPTCCFDCVPCANNRISTIEDQNECTQCPEDHYSNDNNTECLMKETAVLAWTDTVVIAFLAWSGVGCALTFATILIFYFKKECEIVKSSSRDLSLMLQMGILTGFISPILFITPPTDIICQLRIAVPSILASFILAVFLIKIYMVIKIFNRGKKAKSMANSKIRLKKFRFLLVSLITGLQVSLVVAAFITFPVEIHLDNVSSMTETIIECKATIRTYIYNESFNLILIIVCFVLAFRARKTPHNYHEARFISVVMTFWIIIFLVSIPIHLFTVGELEPIITVMFILILNTLILIMLFLPKCYFLFVASKNDHTNTSQRISKSFTDSCATLSSAKRESGIQDCSPHDFNTNL
ncbi:extracellular calcium-sensing receptor-like [Anneissia japonica]|uniref:extracellular calcium-sensing receptor-like n=1 Tax=Anneissia japonica TaxID=1529436 RepID=UPI0014255D8F|nr:extracellular calcium-sensing receptor-like [Anneissia japonica]